MCSRGQLESLQHSKLCSHLPPWKYGKSRFYAILFFVSLWTLLAKEVCTVGYNDFDFLTFFDKMKPPKPEIDVKWDSKTHL